jgi:hypothetical protein
MYAASSKALVLIAALEYVVGKASLATNVMELLGWIITTAV